ncbi:MAG: acyl carrier protein [Clostridia bacterium]|nr:acyl carrier protein [Clostridia bacterium]
MSNLEQYKQIFTKVFGVDEAVLDDSFTFASVPQWDSVAHLSLISEIEEAFDVFFESEDILHYGSFMNGIEILKRYGVDFEG